MPLYSYRCFSCNHEFDVIRKFSDDGTEYCPECYTKLTMDNRIVAKTGFKLEGNGWYKDGYIGKDASKHSYQ